MRKEQLINDNWLFRYHDGTETVLNIPHTWNAQDGQDGGNDYWRGTCVYEKTFPMPEFSAQEAAPSDPSPSMAPKGWG